MCNTRGKVPRVQLDTLSVCAFNMRVLMITIANKPTQCLGNVRTISPELCWLLDELSINGSLARHTLMYKLYNVMWASLHPGPRVLREQTTWVWLLNHVNSAIHELIEGQLATQDTNGHACPQHKLQHRCSLMFASCRFPEEPVLLDMREHQINSALIIRG